MTRQPRSGAEHARLRELESKALAALYSAMDNAKRDPEVTPGQLANSVFSGHGTMPGSLAGYRWADNARARLTHALQQGHDPARAVRYAFRPEFEEDSNEFADHGQRVLDTAGHGRTRRQRLNWDDPRLQSFGAQMLLRDFRAANGRLPTAAEAAKLLNIDLNVPVDANLPAKGRLAETA